MRHALIQILTCFPLTVYYYSLQLVSFYLCDKRMNETFLVVMMSVDRVASNFWEVNVELTVLVLLLLITTFG